MSRKIKNILMITIIIVVCVLSYFTMNRAVISDKSFKRELGETTRNFNNVESSGENRPQRPSDNFEEEKSNKEEARQNSKNSNSPQREIKSNISWIYYILFAVEGLTISLLLTYLIMSNFNNKTFKETLNSSPKIIIYIILVLIITVGLTVVQAMLAKNVFTANKSNVQFENRQRPGKNTNNTKNRNITNVNEINTL